MNKIGLQTLIIFGASVANIIVCCCLIPFTQSIGASIGRTVAEFIQLPFLIFFSYKFINYKDVFMPSIKPLISSVVMSVAVFLFIYFVNLNVWVEIVVAIIIGAVLYYLLEMVFRDEFVVTTTKQVFGLIKRPFIKKSSEN